MFNLTLQSISNSETVFHFWGETVLVKSLIQSKLIPFAIVLNNVLGVYMVKKVMLNIDK